MLKVAIGKTLAFVRGVDVLQAQLHLEELVEEAERGEAVAIERDGEPVAMLVRYRGASPRAGWGLGGQGADGPDFDEGIRRIFEEGEVEPPL